MEEKRSLEQDKSKLNQRVEMCERFFRSMIHVPSCRVETGEQIQGNRNCSHGTPLDHTTQQPCSCQARPDGESSQHSITNPYYSKMHFSSDHEPENDIINPNQHPGPVFEPDDGQECTPGIDQPRSNLENLDKKQTVDVSSKPMTSEQTGIQGRKEVEEMTSDSADDEKSSYGTKRRHSPDEFCPENVAFKGQLPGRECTAGLEGDKKKLQRVALGYSRGPRKLRREESCLLKTKVEGTDKSCSREATDEINHTKLAEKGEDELLPETFQRLGIARDDGRTNDVTETRDAREEGSDTDVNKTDVMEEGSDTDANKTDVREEGSDTDANTRDVRGKGNEGTWK